MSSVAERRRRACGAAEALRRFQKTVAESASELPPPRDSRVKRGLWGGRGFRDHDAWESGARHGRTRGDCYTHARRRDARRPTLPRPDSAATLAHRTRGSILVRDQMKYPGMPVGPRVDRRGAGACTYLDGVDLPALKLTVAELDKQALELGHLCPYRVVHQDDRHLFRR